MTNNDTLIQLNESVNRRLLLTQQVYMAATVMAYLAFTWSTAVLLGGYVTSLEKKDFCCLTLISLAEATRIFNDMEHKQLMETVFSFVVNSGKTAIDFAKDSLPKWKNLNSGLLYNIHRFKKRAAILYAGILMAPVMLVIFSILILVRLSPVLFVALPAWRLWQHDYGVIGGDSSKATLAPALEIFYSLVLVQGILDMFWLAIRNTVGQVLRRFYELCKFPVEWATEAVGGYIEDTQKKDIGSVQSASLFSHASELMGSDACDKYVTGVRVLGTFAKQRMEEGSAFTILLSRAKIQKLILTLGLTQSSVIKQVPDLRLTLTPTLTELREHASRIVAGLAEGIHLGQFPGAARCISTLLEATGDGSSELILQGLAILEKLAQNHVNCREICSTPGLLPKIMAPICSGELIQDTRIARSRVVRGTFKVLRGLTRAPGKAGRRLRREISCNKQAVTNLESIVLDESNQSSCKDQGNKDGDEVQILAMEILLELLTDESIDLRAETIQNIIKKQLQIFLGNGSTDTLPEAPGRKPASTSTWDVRHHLRRILAVRQGHPEAHDARRGGQGAARFPEVSMEGTPARKVGLSSAFSEAAAVAVSRPQKGMAGKSLSVLSSNSERNATIIMEAHGDTVGRLIKMLDATDIWHKIFAVEILRNLCKHCALDKELLNKNLLPKALLEIFKLIKRKKQAVAPENETSSSSGVDEENQNSKEKPGSEDEEQQLAVKVLQEALLCLTLKLYDLVGADRFALEVQQAAPGDGAFVEKLKAIIRDNCEAKETSLRIVKLCCQIAISMLQRNQYTAQFKDLVESVSEASEIMFEVESCRLITDTTGLEKKTLRPFLSDLENQLKQELDRAGSLISN